ncbi:MAG: creatininase family protein, partial [Nitrososphaeraceae archaeon]
PELVQMQNAKRGHLNKKRLNSTYTTFLSNTSSFKITRNGVLGDPRKATKEEGKKIISITMKNLVRILKELDDLLIM